MSIRKVSDLDSYLSVGTTPNSEEQFKLDKFKESLFEISKKEELNTGVADAGNQHLFSSRNINGNDLINAMRCGLSNYFADTTVLDAFSEKLMKIMDLYDYDTTTKRITALNLNAPIVLNVEYVIEGTARKALWS